MRVSVGSATVAPVLLSDVTVTSVGAVVALVAAVDVSPSLEQPDTTSTRPSAAAVVRRAARAAGVR